MRASEIPGGPPARLWVGSCSVGPSWPHARPTRMRTCRQDVQICRCQHILPVAATHPGCNHLPQPSVTATRVNSSWCLPSSSPSCFWWASFSLCTSLLLFSSRRWPWASFVASSSRRWLLRRLSRLRTSVWVWVSVRVLIWASGSGWHDYENIELRWA